MTNQTITPPASKQEAIDLLKSDLQAWNRMREANPEWIPDLRYSDLRDSDLRGAYLSGADLRNAYLSGADLRDAYLRYSDLRYSDLRDANLRYANLRYSDLYGANLRDAKVSRNQIAPYIGEPDWQE